MIFVWKKRVSENDQEVLLTIWAYSWIPPEILNSVVIFFKVDCCTSSKPASLLATGSPQSLSLPHPTFIPPSRTWSEPFFSHQKKYISYTSRSRIVQLHPLLLSISIMSHPKCRTGVFHLPWMQLKIKSVQIYEPCFLRVTRTPFWCILRQESWSYSDLKQPIIWIKRYRERVEFWNISIRMWIIRITKWN